MAAITHKLTAHAASLYASWRLQLDAGSDQFRPSLKEASNTSCLAIEASEKFKDLLLNEVRATLIKVGRVTFGRVRHPIDFG